jgi:hypothetical protein
MTAYELTARTGCLEIQFGICVGKFIFYYGYVVGVFFSTEI